MRTPPQLSRRDFLNRAGATFASTALLSSSSFGGPKREEIVYPKGKAQHCIFVWLGGGAAHIDTWDPKRQGDFKQIAGSAYPSIDTAIPGVQVCSHLSNCAKVLDRISITVESTFRLKATRCEADVETAAA